MCKDIPAPTSQMNILSSEQQHRAGGKPGCAGAEADPRLWPPSPQQPALSTPPPFRPGAHSVPRERGLGSGASWGLGPELCPRRALKAPQGSVRSKGTSLKVLSELHSIRQIYMITAGHLLPSFQDWPRTHHRSSSHSDSPRQHSRANFSGFPEKHRALCCPHSPQSLWVEQQRCRPVGCPSLLWPGCRLLMTHGPWAGGLAQPPAVHS